eukprot:scaffold101463_cov75-Phaeocystis_antarctica.AAC.3
MHKLDCALTGHYRWRDCGDATPELHRHWHHRVIASRIGAAATAEEGRPAVHLLQGVLHQVIRTHHAPVTLRRRLVFCCDCQASPAPLPKLRGTSFTRALEAGCLDAARRWRAVRLRRFDGAVDRPWPVPPALPAHDQLEVAQDPFPSSVKIGGFGGASERRRGSRAAFCAGRPCSCTLEGCDGEFDPLCLQQAEGPSNAAWPAHYLSRRAGGDCGRPRAGPTVASALRIRGHCWRQFQSRTGIREVPPSRAHGATLGIVCVAERLLGVRAGPSRPALCTTHAVCAEGRPGAVCLAQHECARAVARGHTLSSCPAAA